MQNKKKQYLFWLVSIVGLQNCSECSDGAVVLRPAHLLQPSFSAESVPIFWFLLSTCHFFLLLICLHLVPPVFSSYYNSWQLNNRPPHLWRLPRKADGLLSEGQQIISPDSRPVTLQSRQSCSVPTNDNKQIFAHTGTSDIFIWGSDGNQVCVGSVKCFLILG